MKAERNIPVDGRNFMHPSRRLEVTQKVYGGISADCVTLQKTTGQITEVEKPAATPYKLYWGEIHGHTELSDGKGTLDDYFQTARDKAQLDFCAVTDHDHGGPGREELWGWKWDLTRQKVTEYHNPGLFVTLLAYERDSWPWYSNLCLYYRDGTGEMVRGKQDGEITREELAELLAREDIIVIPHHTADLGQGVNFECIAPELMAPLIEVYSKWGCSEYFGNPRPVRRESRGGHWQDALELGACMGCVAGSDVHNSYPGLRHSSLEYDEPGLAAVLATDLTHEAVFDALKNRRCYGSSGDRIVIDFRIEDAVMGQEIELAAGARRRIYLHVKGQTLLSSVTVVKNSRDYFVDHTNGASDRYDLCVYDIKAERKTDYYYVRVTQQNGCQAWSSPIWVTAV